MPPRGTGDWWQHAARLPGRNPPVVVTKLGRVGRHRNDRVMPDRTRCRWPRLTVKPLGVHSRVDGRCSINLELPRRGPVLSGHASIPDVQEPGKNRRGGCFGHQRAVAGLRCRFVSPHIGGDDSQDNQAEERKRQRSAKESLHRYGPRASIDRSRGTGRQDPGEWFNGEPRLGSVGWLAAPCHSCRPIPRWGPKAP